MNFLRSLLPWNKSSNIDPLDELKIWQDRLLQTMMFVGAFFGLVLTLFSLISQGSDADRSILIGGLVLLIITTLLIFLRKYSYWIRSIIALTAVFFFANLIFASTGWGGVALILLLGFSFLCSTFLYKTPSRIGIGISLVTLLFWAALRFTNLVPTNMIAPTFLSAGVDVILVILVGAIGNMTLLSLKSRYLNEHNSFSRLEADHNTLSNTLKEQSFALERRLTQLKTASEISQTISTILNPQVLMQQVAELIAARFDLYYVGVFLIDASKEYAVLQFGTGEAGKRMIAARHRLAVGGYSMIGWATQSRRPRIALDVGDEAVHFDNPFLPETRSELALPIINANNVLGALSVQSIHPNAFDENDILILQSVADNLGIALENANSFQRTQQALEEIRILNRAYVQQAWWDTLDETSTLNFDFEDEAKANTSKNTNSVQIPLKLREETIGQFSLDIEGTEMSKEQTEFLESVLTQTSIALENARLLEETQRAALQEQKLNDLSSQFSRSLTIEEILKTAVSEFGKLPSVSGASISLISPEDISETKQKALPESEGK